MTKILYIITIIISFLLAGCTKEEDIDGDYKYHIEGFDSIYEEGHEYLIIVKIYIPRYEMPDLYESRYKFIKLIRRQ